MANWDRARQDRQRRKELQQGACRLPTDGQDAAVKARMHADFHRSGDRGVSVRGAQGADSYARRNYTKVTLPRIKFLEGDA